MLVKLREAFVNGLIFKMHENQSRITFVGIDLRITTMVGRSDYKWKMSHQKNDTYLQGVVEEIEQQLADVREKRLRVLNNDKSPTDSDPPAPQRNWRHGCTN